MNIVIVINLPPLRDRREDIPLLVEHFLEHYSERGTRQTIPAHVMEALAQHDWPGNVRELQNVLQRYLAGERLEFIDTRRAKSVEQSSRELEQEDLSLRESFEAYEKRLITRVLDQYRGYTKKTAEMLDIPLTTLYRKIKKYQI